MRQPLACADLVATLIALPRPILFLDTAAILDILRVPFRRELQVDIVDSAVTVVDDALADPRRIWLVSTANVMHELDGRRGSVTDELHRGMRELSKSITHISSLARMVFPEKRIASPEGVELILGERILQIMDRLVDSTMVYRGTATCIGKASERVWAGIPPASEAKQEYKDCEIFEEFLELLTTIRGQGFEQPAVFVSPNREDYGPPPDGHPRVKSDLAALDAQYAANLSWARKMARSGAS